MSTKRNAGLHPESLSLLRSIENENSNRRNSKPADRALGKTTPGGTTLVKLFGGFGVASLAIASYVSGYKSTSRELLSLGENKVKNKVVLHTGCSPVAQVRFRDLIAQRRGLSLSLRLKIFVSSYY